LEYDFTSPIDNVEPKGIVEIKTKVVQQAVTFTGKKLLDARLSTAVVCGSQSSGKSSLANAMSSHFKGEPVDFSPVSEDLATRTCVVVSYAQIESPYLLYVPNGRTQAVYLLNTDREVCEKLVEYWGTFRDNEINLTDEKACRLLVKSTESCQIRDCPGYRNDTDAKVYFENVTDISNKHSPLIVATVNVREHSHDLASSFMLGDICKMMEADSKWQGASVFVALTHVDETIAAGKTQILTDSVQALRQRFAKNKIPVKFGLLILKSEAGNNSTSETRKAEHETLSKVFAFTSATYNKEPLFTFGVNEMKDYLVYAMGETITKDKKFLTDFSEVLHKEIKAIDLRTKTLENCKTVGSVVMDVIKQMDASMTKEKVDCARLLRTTLRQIVAERYEEKWVKNTQPETVVHNKYSEAQYLESVDVQAADKKWEEMTKDFIETISRRSADLSDLILGVLTSKSRRILAPYAGLTVLHEVLTKVFDDFKKVQLVKFRDDVMTSISDHTLFMEQRKENDVEAQRSDWPKNCAFVKNADLGSKSTVANFERRVLSVMVTILSGIVTDLVIKKVKLDIELHGELTKLTNDPTLIESEIETRTKRLMEEKAEYITTLNYTQILIDNLRREELMNQPRNDEPATKSQKGFFGWFSSKQ
jgi:hypothetical protein